MSIEDKVNRMKRKVDSLKDDKRLAEIRTDETLEKLSDKFGVDDLDSAKTLLEQKTAKLAKKKTRLEERYDGFTEKYGEELDIN